MRILVVEDDAEAATAMLRGLTEAGHQVSHAPPSNLRGLFVDRKGASPKLCDPRPLGQT